nr:hypothetical protein [Tanacetum cinerariifolium]
FNQVRNRYWKECFTLPGGVSGHIETISSSLIQILEKMVFLKTWLGVLFLDIIVLSSDSKDINEGPSKGKVPKKDINEGPSKEKLPHLGLSARPRLEVSSELAKLFMYGPPPALLRWYGYNDVDEYLEDTLFDSPKKDTKDKSSLDTFPGSTDEETSNVESTDKIIVGTTCKKLLFYKDTIEKYVPIVKFVSKKSIFKSPQTIIGVVLGLANLKTWDDIVKK